MGDKVKIELTPFDAKVIALFLKNHIIDENFTEYELTPFINAVNQYISEVRDNLTHDQNIDAELEHQINQLIGKSPKR